MVKSKVDNDIEKAPIPAATPQTAKKVAWYNKFRVNQDDAPREIYNAVLFLSVFVFGVLGCGRGYDEGLIGGSTSLPSFKERFGLADKTKTKSQLANLKSNITSMVQLGSVGGSLFAVYLCDKLGRVRACQFCCVAWIIAAIIQVTSKSIGQLYAGRLLEGLFGIGPTVVCGPVYLSEVAPKSIRGLCNNIFAGAVYLGIMLGYFTNYGCILHISNDSDKQWIIPTSVKIILAGVILTMSFFFCVESPRWLIKQGNIELATKNFSKIRNLPADHPYILSEISDINEQLAIEARETHGTSIFSMLKELFTRRSICHRMLLALMVQILAQWSGSNAVTIYANELLKVIGIKTTAEIMKMTAVLGVIKFVSAYISAFFLIDFLGRRRSLYTGITLQFFTLLYVAIFLNVVPQAQSEDFVPTPSQKRASQGALAAIYLSGTAWTFGWNAIQYLINSEILPLRVRSLGTSLIMCFHFLNQYGNTKAIPKMLLSMDNYGAFYFFCGILLIGLGFNWFFIPELSGRSLESMEDLFSLPWYLVGRRGNELAPDHSQVGMVHTDEKGEVQIDMSKAVVNNVENAENTENTDSDKTNSV